MDKEVKYLLLKGTQLVTTELSLNPDDLAPEPKFLPARIGISEQQTLL